MLNWWTITGDLFVYVGLLQFWKFHGQMTIPDVDFSVVDTMGYVLLLLFCFLFDKFVLCNFIFLTLILWMQSSFRNSSKFFDWYDPEFPTQANIVILGLLKKTNKQEEQLKCKWILKLILGISLICNVILFFYLVCRWFFLMQLLLVWFGVPCSTDLGYSFCGLVWFGILLMYVFAVFADQYNYM